VNTFLIDNIVALAQEDEDIRTTILEGSFSTHSHIDELSDYDVNVFARNYDKYLADDHWMSRIGEVMLYQKEQFQFYQAIISTRLVIFRDRERVDFSFWHLSLLSDIVEGDKVYESYKNGYQILVDKDHLAENLSPPDGTGFRISPPDRDRFLQTIYSFWFEAYCIARYLSRRDLWFAKRIEDSYIKDHLYRMALWHHQAVNRWKPNPLLHTEGKRFEKWASPELIEAIGRCFSLYDVESTWSSLFAMMELFDRLARQTSTQLHVEFPERVERDVLDYLEYLKDIPLLRLLTANQ
jgi:aminoglycoside 6-adenylyltransferase